MVLIVPAIRTQHLTGVVNKGVTQTPYLIRDLAICIKNTKNIYLVPTFNRHFACINNILSRCLLRANLRYLMLSDQHSNNIHTK